MTKKFLIAILAVLLVFGLASCNGDAGSKGGGGSEPTRPATLELRNFKETYMVNEAAQGTLIYTDTKGTINPVGITDSGVTSTFDSAEACESKIAIFKYKGIDCIGTYSVVAAPEVLDVAGCFVVDDNTTYEFTSNSNKVIVEKYNSWGDYQDVNPIEPAPDPQTYTVKVSSNGLTYALVGDKRFYPDGNGGFEKYESDYLAEPEYGTGCYYVSDDKESSSVYIGPTDQKALGKYLVIQFTTDYKMKMWFVDSTQSAPTVDPDYVIETSKIKFGKMGVFIKDTDIGDTKNLRMYSKNDFKESITIVSPSGDNYRGYSYRLTYKQF